MNCQNAKKIDLVSFLKKQGLTPSKTKGENVWFLSPFRKETTPSLKIDTNQNLWYDFGEGAGGKSVLDFVIRLKNCSVKEALENPEELLMDNDVKRALEL
jgi:DNA primase